MSSEKKVTFAEQDEEKSGRFKGKHSLDSDEESDGQEEGSACVKCSFGVFQNNPCFHRCLYSDENYVCSVLVYICSRFGLHTPYLIY